MRTPFFSKFICRFCVIRLQILYTFLIYFLRSPLNDTPCAFLKGWIEDQFFFEAFNLLRYFELEKLFYEVIQLWHYSILRSRCIAFSECKLLRKHDYSCSELEPCANNALLLLQMLRKVMLKAEIIRFTFLSLFRLIVISLERSLSSLRAERKKERL